MINTCGLPWKFEFKPCTGISYIVDFNDMKHGNPVLYVTAFERQDDESGRNYYWSAEEISSMIRNGYWRITNVLEENEPYLPKIDDFL